MVKTISKLVFHFLVVAVLTYFIAGLIVPFLTHPHGMEIGFAIGLVNATCMLPTLLFFMDTVSHRALGICTALGFVSGIVALVLV